MSVLEWILILEGILLGVAGIMGLVGLLIARQDPDDPISRFAATFWREFLWPPEVMAIDADEIGGQPPAQEQGSSPHRAMWRSREEEEADALYGRTRKAADGAALKTDLAVLVEPNAAGDAVAGRDGDGLRIRVVGEAGESRSNKALIEMVASAIGVQPYQVTLTKGHYQTRKTVQVQGIAPDELQEKLSSLPEAE